MNAPFPAHHATIAALREENDILRETVRQLREELAHVVAFPAAWKLTPQQATVLSCIMAASPGIATYNRLLAALYGDREEPDTAAKVLNTVVCEIRKRLLAADTDACIRNVVGRGYVMTPAARERLLSAPDDTGFPNPFWWTKARRLRSEGASYRAISAACGKSYDAVYRMMNEERRASDIERRRTARRRASEAEEAAK